jgi:hypothetical protein
MEKLIADDASAADTAAEPCGPPVEGTEKVSPEK